jgi:hypothetical protein
MPINKEFCIVVFVLLEDTSLVKVFPADIGTVAKIGIEKATVAESRVLKEYDALKEGSVEVAKIYDRVLECRAVDARITEVAP